MLRKIIIYITNKINKIYNKIKINVNFKKKSILFKIKIFPLKYLK